MLTYKQYYVLYIFIININHIIFQLEKAMIHKEVKKTMIDQGITVKQLAKITGYTHGHIGNVINGRLESKRAKKVIALALNKDFYMLWDRQNAA